MVKGTLVHAALEGLMWSYAPSERTRAAAQRELERAWVEVQGDPEFVSLELDEQGRRQFVADAGTLVDNYFLLEDPTTVRPVGVELGLEVVVGTMRLRGIIDRLDINEDGGLVVIDYKTGRAPSEHYESTKLKGVHIYALLCMEAFGRLPVEVRLLHLREPMTITAVPSEQSLRGQRQQTNAVWTAIERACDKEDFRPRPSPLCKFCNFQEYCPTFGGAPPVHAA